MGRFISPLEMIFGPMFTEITKRNGTKVPFDQEKIIIAMRKAFSQENTPVTDDVLRQMMDRVTTKLEGICDALTEGPCPTVEQVQDLVEETLMERGYFIVAKHYILYRFKQTEDRKDEVVKEIEENRLMIKTAEGEEQFSRDSVRTYVETFTEGLEADIDLDGVVNQIEREVYDGISTKELTKLVTLVLRSKVELDPAYSQVAARQLCGRVYEEAIAADVDPKANTFAKKYRDAFTRNIKIAVTDKKLAKNMLDFDMSKISAAIMPERDDLFRYLGVETLNDRYFIHAADGHLLETPQFMWMRVAMGLSANEA
ncbi:MAG: ribonucleoside-diphosphate reductase alpha chain, partial [Acidimicrobiales bacterium]